MNSCEFVLSFEKVPLNNADKFGNKIEQHIEDIVYCGRPASIKYDGLRYCADHFDEIQRAANGIVINGIWHYWSFVKICA